MTAITPASSITKLATVLPSSSMHVRALALRASANIDARATVRGRTLCSAAPPVVKRRQSDLRLNETNRLAAEINGQATRNRKRYLRRELDHRAVILDDNRAVSGRIVKEEEALIVFGDAKVERAYGRIIRALSQKNVTILLALCARGGRCGPAYVDVSVSFFSSRRIGKDVVL